MVQLVFTATGNIPKLADVINGVTPYDPYDSFRIATEISKGIVHKFSIEKSIEEVYKLVNSTMPAGTLNWHFINIKTGDIFGGTSGKKEVKEEKPVKKDFVLTIYAVSGEWDRLRDALKNSLNITKDDASILTDIIYKEVRKNGLWRSALMHIDISIWIVSKVKDEWSIYDNNANELIASSGKTKKSKGARTEETKKSSKSEKINEIINSNLQELNKYCCGLEEENLELSIRVNQLLKEREGLLKERDGLSAKLDVLSDKFIKLKSIID